MSGLAPVAAVVDTIRRMRSPRRRQHDGVVGDGDTRAPRWTCPPRRSSERTTHSPGRCGDLGQDALVADLDQVEASSRRSTSGSASAARSRATTPRRSPRRPRSPPPTNVTVSNRAALRAGGQRAAWSNAVSSRSRMATASSTCFSRSPRSVTPGIGERAGDRARGEHDGVVRAAGGRGPPAGWTVTGAVLVVDPGDGAADHVRVRQVRREATPLRGVVRPIRRRPPAGTAGRSCTAAGR